MDIIKVVAYTVVMYFYLIVIIRLMGKREVGSLSVFDLAVYFTISDLITISIVDHTIPFWFTVVAVAVLCLLQILLAMITLKSKKIRDLIDGSKSLIINDGVIDFKEMKKQRYTIDDLYSQIREQGIDSVTLIRWAILETSGKLSVITYKDSIANFPDPLITDGIIEKDNLKKANVLEEDLLKSIHKLNVDDIKDIRLCLYINENFTFIFKSNKTVEQSNKMDK